MKSILFSILFILIALLASKVSFFRKSNTIKPVVTQVQNYMTASVFDPSKPKTPVFFFSHGGPTFMYRNDEFGSNPKAYDAVKKAGKVILNKIKPSFIISISAHWESSYENTIEVAIPGQSLEQPLKNTLDPLENPLIYDFYGFPEHMYKVQFHSRNDLELANDIRDTLASKGFNSKLTQRGLDHGTWVPLKVAFSSNREGEEWDIDVPLVQVSLNGYNDGKGFQLHRKLGNVLAKYREMGGVVICSGMIVHNLRDLGLAIQSKNTLPYASKFNSIISNIMTTTKSGERFKRFDDLKTKDRALLYKSHPSLEHFLPLIVASGAAEDDPVKEYFAGPEMSMGWGIYQLGEAN